MKMSRRTRGIAATLAMGLVAAACGGGGDSGSGAKAGDAPGDEGPPVSGGRVIYALEAETNAGWCLAESQLAISGIQVAKTIYDTLVQPDESGKMLPMLAESVEPNATFDSWTIKIREGVKFHDGTKLDAEVVKNNLDAYRGKYDGRSPLLFVFVLQNIKAVDVTDPMTVTITTKTPWPALPSFLYSSGRLGMSAQAQLDSKDNCDKDLIGTGPFKLKEWKLNDHFTAVKNPDYWQKDADGTQLPYLDEIEYRPVPDTDSRVEGVQTGQFDMIHTNGGEAVSQLQPLADSGTINMIANSDAAEVTYLMANEAKAPFDNLDARKAVAYGINREEFKKLRAAGLQDVASGPFAPGNLGYLEDTGFPEFDVAKAKEHAAAYKKATGKDLSFTMSYAADASTKISAELLQSQLADSGIEMKLTSTDQAALIDRAIGGDFELAYFRNHPGGDPDNQYVWWHSSSPVNFGKINDPQVDKALDDGRVESDEAKRAGIYEGMNERFADQVHNIWLIWSLWTVSSQPNVHGVFGPDVDGEKPFTGLASGHPVTGLWVDGGGA
ncbi:MAG: ABC transporter substrate-binding protein [Candidatus Microthrix parvicella]